MPEKNELIQLLIMTLRDLAATTLTEWDQLYLRNYSLSRGHASRECVYRIGREVTVLDDEPDAYGRLFRKLLPSLFDVVEVESGKRPMVAVFTVSKEGNYDATFAYDDPRALEITLLALGKPSSYFRAGEVDTPDHIREYQQELAKKGVTTTPVVVPAGQDIGRHFGDDDKE